MRIVSALLLTAIGLNALFAGLAFVTYPDGRLLGLSISLLKHAPFPDFYLPGLFLLGGIGFSSIFAAIAVMANDRRHPWLVAAQGLVLVLWILCQMAFLRQANLLQISLLLLGLALIAMGLLLTKPETK